MLRALAALALGLCVGGCLEREPTFDTSSAQAYAASFERVNDRLSDEQRKALREALLTLAASAEGEGGQEDTVARDFLKIALVASPALAAGWLVAALGDEIDGLTAGEVIRRAHQAEIGTLEGRLARVETRLAALPDEIAEAERRATGNDRALEAVTVADASYGWSDDGFVGRPAIEFRLTNGLAAAIGRVVFRCVLTTPGRPAPWAEQSFERRFRPELPPGAEERLRLLPNRFSAWSDLSLRALTDARLSVRVVEVETAAGQRLPVTAGAAPVRLKQELEKLQASRDKLRRRIERLRTQLAEAT